jgi:hypothetical protein
VLFRSESTWDSPDFNILRNIVPALQLILSYLPADHTICPYVQEIQMAHVVNYFMLECDDVWFTCPALPYRIMFKKKQINDQGKLDVPREIKDAYALAAYVDLIETAEYALPSGDEDNWKDPTQLSLWEEVRLGGQYFMGNSRRPVNIIIKLTAKSDSYYITECNVVSDDDFVKFSFEFSKWREALRDYYDVYVSKGIKEEATPDSLSNVSRSRSEVELESNAKMPILNRDVAITYQKRLLGTSNLIFEGILGIGKDRAGPFKDISIGVSKGDVFYLQVSDDLLYKVTVTAETHKTINLGFLRLN